MLTDAEDVGLIFPTPAPATVTAGDRQTFVDIETAIQPREVIVDDWWDINFGSAPARPTAAARRSCSIRCSSGRSRRRRSRPPTPRG